MTLERKVNEGNWKEISAVVPKSGSGKIICVDNDSCKNILDIKDLKKPVKISYRLKIIDSKGKVNYSNVVFYDFWWKKLHTYYHQAQTSGYDSTANDHIKDIYFLIDQVVKLIVKRNFYSMAKHLNIEADFLIDEVRHDIFEKLLTNKERPNENFNNFWSYIANATKNRVVSIFRAKRSESIENINLDILDENSPETLFISTEKRELIRNEFSNLFNKYLIELWQQSPKYALVIELWLKIRLSLTKESLELIFSAMVDRDFSRDEKAADDEDSYYVYKKIMNELRELKANTGNYDSGFVHIKNEKREAFNHLIDELFEDEKKAETRLRQWLFRGINIIRTKMQPMLDYVNSD